MSVVAGSLPAAAAAFVAALGPESALGIGVFDARLRCLAASPALRALGGDAEQVLPPPVVAPLLESLAAVRDGAPPIRHPELSGPDPDGPVYRAGCYRLDGPSEPLVAVLVADITERVRTQRRVRENRERLEMAERLALVGAWTWWPQDEHRWSWSEQLLRLAGFDPAAGAPPYEVWIALVDPEDRERALAARGRALCGEPAEVTVRQRRPDGTRRVLQIIAAPNAAGGRVTRVDGVVQDVTDAARAAARRSAVADLGRAALEGLPLDELVERARGAIEDVLDLPGVTIDRHAPAPPDEVGLVAEIPGADEPWGFIAVPTVLPGEDLDFLRAVANVLGNAIARLGLEAELTDQADARGRLVAAALDAEDRTRREISETLHDGPLQDLLALNQFVARLEPADDREALHLSRARAELARAIGGLRDVMLELHPVVLDVGGLESALGAVAAQQGRLGGFRADVRIEPASCGIRDELVLSLARELLVNAAKHAQASRVEVSVRRSDGAVVLVVADDGRGMPEGRPQVALREGHIGLASSRQRVEAVGGRLLLSAGAGSGTRVTAVLPDR